jgi:hypothetical protein
VGGRVWALRWQASPRYSVLGSARGRTRRSLSVSIQPVADRARVRRGLGATGTVLGRAMLTTGRSSILPLPEHLAGNARFPVGMVSRGIMMRVCVPSPFRSGGVLRSLARRFDRAAGSVDVHWVEGCATGGIVVASRMRSRPVVRSPYTLHITALFAGSRRRGIPVRRLRSTGCVRFVGLAETLTVRGWSAVPTSDEASLVVVFGGKILAWTRTVRRVGRIMSRRDGVFVVEDGGPIGRRRSPRRCSRASRRRPRC